MAKITVSLEDSEFTEMLKVLDVGYMLNPDNSEDTDLYIPDNIDSIYEAFTNAKYCIDANMTESYEPYISRLVSIAKEPNIDIKALYSRIFL